MLAVPAPEKNIIYLTNEKKKKKNGPKGLNCFKTEYGASHFDKVFTRELSGWPKFQLKENFAKFCDAIDKFPNIRSEI